MIVSLLTMNMEMIKSTTALQTHLAIGVQVLEPDGELVFPQVAGHMVHDGLHEENSRGGP